jgi:putative Holliday junction resolvase
MGNKKTPAFTGNFILTQGQGQVNNYFWIFLRICAILLVNETVRSKQTMKVMAIDYGDARTGVAISDPSGLITGRSEVIQTWDREKAAAEVARLYRESGAERIVVGLPRNMDGSEGARAELCRAFAARLQELTGVEPVMWDERRTTVEAHNILSGNGKKMKKHRETVDAVAASLILEGYLARLRSTN